MNLLYETIHRIISEEVQNVLNEVYKVKPNQIMEFGTDAVSKKRKYAQRLWNMIQSKYAYIGGCKSFDSINGDDGFTDFLNGKYIWRIYFGENANDILGIVVYKPTKFGRKRICSTGVDKESYLKLIDDDLKDYNHVYGEVSGKSEKFMSKQPKTTWVNNRQVSSFLPNKQIDLNQYPNADSNEKVPYNKDKHYYRLINGERHRKAMFGNPLIPNTQNR